MEKYEKAYNHIEKKQDFCPRLIFHPRKVWNSKRICAIIRYIMAQSCGNDDIVISGKVL